MRIVQANAVYDPAATTPDALLDLYRTLTEWSAAVARAGADVSVVQRFHTAATVERDGIRYELVKDAEPPWLSTKGAPPAFVDAIAKEAAGVVHVNGLIFPQLVASIRARSGPATAIVVQHHGGEFPIRGSGLVGMWQRQRWRGGLAAANAISFTAAEQAEPWRAAGVLASQRVIEIVEASTTIRAVNRERARTAIGATGSPVILWVGRLTTNKDPLAVLDGLERALPQLPDARAILVFGDDTLIESVEQRVRESAMLNDRVTLAGRVPHDEMPNYYGAADLYVSGSHSEGSGYALIEAMSAGVIPVVTDIPSFRAIAGAEHARWTPGDADGLARALVETCASDLNTHKAAVKDRFARLLSWDAIGARTVAEYRTLS
ncbi:MAG: glycosyltransferase family 4 protein [Cyanobacteria bacterium]|nr:glycosyltransferase family 4 protein [Cyanobacteriota bacterium]